MRGIDLILFFLYCFLVRQISTDNGRLAQTLITTNGSLQQFRKAVKWSQEDIAWELEVDVSTYARWERAVQQPHLRNAAKFGNIFMLKTGERLLDDWRRRTGATVKQEKA